MKTVLLLVFAFLPLVLILIVFLVFYALKVRGRAKKSLERAVYWRGRYNDSQRDVSHWFEKYEEAQKRLNEVAGIAPTQEELDQVLRSLGVKKRAS